MALSVRPAAAAAATMECYKEGGKKKKRLRGARAGTQTSLPELRRALSFFARLCTVEVCLILTSSCVRSENVRKKGDLCIARRMGFACAVKDLRVCFGDGREK